MFAKRMWTVTVFDRLLMAIVFPCSTIATAAATILQVFEADLVGAVAAPLEATFDIGGVSIEKHRAHGHCPR